MNDVHDDQPLSCEQLQVEEQLSAVDAILRYSRSDLPTQQLAFIKGIGAASMNATEEELLSLMELCTHLLSSPLSMTTDDNIRRIVLIATLVEVAAMGRSWPASPSNPEAFASKKEGLTSSLSEALITLAQGTEDDIDAALDAVESVLVSGEGFRGERARSLIEATMDKGPCISSLKIISRLTPLAWSPERNQGTLLQEIVLPLIESYLDDADYSVQETTAAHFPALIPLFPLDLAAEFIPRVSRSLGGHSNWKVRVALANSLPLLIQQLVASASKSECVEGSERVKACIGGLIDLLVENLASDDSQWVASAAHCAAGPALIASSSLDLSPRQKSSLVCLYRDAITSLPRPPPADEMMKLAACLSDVASICHSCPLWEDLNLSLVFNTLMESRMSNVAATAARQVPSLLSLDAFLLSRLVGALLTSISAKSKQIEGPQLDTLALAVSSILLPITEALKLAGVLGEGSGVTVRVVVAFIQGLIQISGLEVNERCSNGKMTDRVRSSKCGSWRIRLNIANQADEIFKCLDPYLGDQDRGVVMSIIKALSEDPVASVRKELARCYKG